MADINIKSSDGNFFNEVPLKIKGGNVVIENAIIDNTTTPPTKIDNSDGATNYLNAQEVLENLKQQSNTNTNNITFLTNNLNTNYYDKSTTEQLISDALISGVTSFTPNKAIISDSNGTLSELNSVDSYDITKLEGLYRYLNPLHANVTDMFDAFESHFTTTDGALDDLSSSVNTLNTQINRTASREQFGRTKIANSLSVTQTFDSNNPIALTAQKGNELQQQITQISNNLEKLYNSSYVYGSTGYYDVIVPSTETSEAVYGVSPYTANGVSVPTSDRDPYGLIPCWPQTSSTYFSSNGLNRIFLKKKGTYLIIMKMVMRPNYNNSNYSNITNGADVYNYFSKELSMRTQINLQIWDSDQGSWSSAVKTTTLQGSGAHDSDVGFFILTTDKDNIQIQFRLFSNNPFRSDNETILRSFGITILHLHSSLSE